MIYDLVKIEGSMIKKLDTTLHLTVNRYLTVAGHNRAVHLQDIRKSIFDSLQVQFFCSQKACESLAAVERVLF